MSLTPSTMVKIGTKAPDFSLEDVTLGKNYSLSSFKDKKALLVMFISRHCPYVQHIKKELSKLDKDYKDNNLGIVAISSNDATDYPEDAPESLREMAKQEDFKFPLLYDREQEVAKTYRAACTPDLFLYDQKRELAYRGQLDDSRPGNNISVTGKDLRQAIEEVLKDLPTSNIQKPSVGCNIKWRQGNEPDYFKH
ncbi:MAG: thioredoxin family protein [Candidatus Levyibacteriota bacterium]